MYLTTASWGPLKKKKIRGPWARAQRAHWLRRPLPSGCIIMIYKKLKWYKKRQFPIAWFTRIMCIDLHVLYVMPRAASQKIELRCFCNELHGIYTQWCHRLEGSIVDVVERNALSSTVVPLSASLCRRRNWFGATTSREVRRAHVGL